MKKLILAVALTASLAAPALAQSYNPEPGAGNVIASTHAPRHALRYYERQSELNAFAMDPQSHGGVMSNGPASTGGGSAGYNENLSNY